MDNEEKNSSSPTNSCLRTNINFLLPASGPNSEEDRPVSNSCPKLLEASLGWGAKAEGNIYEMGIKNGWTEL